MLFRSGGGIGGVGVFPGTDTGGGVTTVGVLTVTGVVIGLGVGDDRMGTGVVRLRESITGVVVRFVGVMMGFSTGGFVC